MGITSLKAFDSDTLGYDAEIPPKQEQVPAETINLAFSDAAFTASSAVIYLSL
ncbi:hypothetical protein PL321_12215 [Caloramator sp. mosi_1]|nr:hypothetical protein [Caloramator sp. mosi_1]WDC83476.1 hypothetical protein PL321_12215 [Caloramator sp. mosi_1]